MKTRIVGLDHGSARIGIALSDEMKILASPLCVFEAKKGVKELLKYLLSHAEEHRYTIEKIVVGLPLLLTGVIGIQANEVQAFIGKLKAETDIPIVTWDERLTTSQAERSMREANIRRKKRAQVVDKLAAVIILQSFLDQII